MRELVALPTTSLLAVLARVLCSFFFCRVSSCRLACNHSAGTYLRWPDQREALTLVEHSLVHSMFMGSLPPYFFLVS
ncbi:hypothetical protein F5B22DRAFT_393638 [Xylaria bambusicola]|uniref:uncharacterized protein n=1 Tax=Xylaria bambusicola TaxID=326684 RepID=UPI0020079A21|nr:uncharacterized protein F5B22DRAFT_393638 [Xylaria bambusicola]KAI0508601.1 hypothetical protein F5B22DRAFT_393638 [Xylaria bambusicola]